MPGGGQEDGSLPVLPAPPHHLCKAQILVPAGMCQPHSGGVSGNGRLCCVCSSSPEPTKRLRKQCLVLVVICAVQRAAVSAMQSFTFAGNSLHRAKEQQPECVLQSLGKVTLFARGGAECFCFECMVKCRWLC